MNRILIKSRADFEKLVSDCVDEIGGDFGFDNLEELERFFGIAFVSAYTDDTKQKYVVNWGFDSCEPGYTPIDLFNDEFDNDILSEQLDQSSYTKEFCFVQGMEPKSYPFIFLFYIENSFDRIGSITQRIGIIVYPEEFEGPSYTEQNKTYIDMIMEGE